MRGGIDRGQRIGHELFGPRLDVAVAVHAIGDGERAGAVDEAAWIALCQTDDAPQLALPYAALDGEQHLAQSFSVGADRLGLCRFPFNLSLLIFQLALLTLSMCHRPTVPATARPPVLCSETAAQRPSPRGSYRTLPRAWCTLERVECKVVPIERTKSRAGRADAKSLM